MQAQKAEMQMIMDSKIAEVKKDLMENIETMKANVIQQNTSLRGEVKQAFDKAEATINSVSTTMNAELGGIKDEMERHRNEMPPWAKAFIAAAKQQAPEAEEAESRELKERERSREKQPSKKDGKR